MRKVKFLTLSPEEHLRNEDRRKAKARARLAPNDGSFKREQDSRRTIIRCENLDILLPMMRREYEPINPLEFQWRKLLRLIGTWKQSALSGARSVLRTLGMSFSRLVKSK